MPFMLPVLGRLNALRIGATVGLAAGVIALASACGGSSTDGGDKVTPSTTGAQGDSATTAGYPICPPAGAARELTGAGSTFVFPLFSKLVDQYQKQCGVKINYQSVGSGAGIQQITARTVDFGASDGIMTEKQEADATAAGGPILHIPVTMGPVAVVVNLPGIQKNQLKLSGDVLADIYLKNIKKWNDDRIKALNPGVSLPNADITVAHRSDGSGTTFIFTNYLGKVSSEWQSKVGNATSVNWPGDVGGQGNEGVAGQVLQLPGAIGYVELAYALQNNLAYVQMRNKSGNFIEPTLDSASKAVEGASIPADAKVVVTDTPNANGYPIVGFTWALAYVNARDEVKGQALAHYLWWAIHDGQKLSTSLQYPAMGADAVKVAEQEILSLKCGATACLTKS
jgi:phosphate transport system substrate-binding protein